MVVGHRCVAFGAGLCGLWCTAATEASFHLMQIEQVIAGLNGDVTEQAIQLRMRANGQTQLAQARIRAWDANGLNPVLIVDLGSSVPNGVTGARVLITSVNFNDDTSPPTTPNFIMTNLIPPSYLAAGSLTWESDTGNVHWRLSWGGASYTGPCTMNAANDADGNSCPPFPGPLPHVCSETLQFQGAANAMSMTNESDYALSGAGAVFTNNAGATFTLAATPIGACCLLDGSCAQAVHEADCAKFGGIFQGICSTCEASNCQPPQLGACCMPDGACIDSIPAVTCAN